MFLVSDITYAVFFSENGENKKLRQPFVKILSLDHIH